MIIIGVEWPVEVLSFWVLLRSLLLWYLRIICIIHWCYLIWVCKVSSMRSINFWLLRLDHILVSIVLIKLLCKGFLCRFTWWLWVFYILSFIVSINKLGLSKQLTLLLGLLIWKQNWIVTCLLLTVFLLLIFERYSVSLIVWWCETLLIRSFRIGLRRPNNRSRLILLLMLIKNNLKTSIRFIF